MLMEAYGMTMPELAGERLPDFVGRPVLDRTGISGMFDFQIEFFVELRKSVGDAIKSGKKLEDLITKTGDKVTGTTIQLPDSVKNWVSTDSLGGDVEIVYKEITLGKPHGDIQLMKQ